MLVDTGAGSHLFQSGFDPHAVESVNDSSKSLVTVTGEPLTSGIRKKSVIECCGKTFNVEYAESDKLQFSVLSSGKMAEKGVWTIVGPGTQCIAQSRFTPIIQDCLSHIETIPLTKSRGVFWLPLETKQSPAGSPADILGGVKAVAKSVPANIYDEVGETGHQDGVSAASSHPSGPGASTDAQPQTGHVEPPKLPELQEPPSEASSEGRKPKAKKIPDTGASIACVAKSVRTTTAGDKQKAT